MKRIIILFLAVIMLIPMTSCSAKDREKKEIIKMVKERVLTDLDTPSTAKFPRGLSSYSIYEDTEYKSSYLDRGDGDKVYQVSGYVDAENLNGAMVRYDFKARVMYFPSENRYYIDYSGIEE